jgi:hypothetical protein
MTLTDYIVDALKDYNRPCNDCVHKKDGMCARWTCEDEERLIAVVKSMYNDMMVR